MSSYRCPLIVVGVGVGFVVVGAVPVAVSYSIGVRNSATMIGMGFVGFGFLLLAPGLVWCVAIRTLHGFKSWRRRSMRRQQGRNQSTVSTPGDGGVGDRCEIGESDDEDDDDVGDATGGNGPSANGRYRVGARADTRLGPSGHGCRPVSAGAANGDRDDRDNEQCINGDGAVRRSGSRQQRRNRSWPSSYSEPPNLIVTDHLVCDASSVQPPTTPQPTQPSSDQRSPLPPLLSDDADPDKSSTDAVNDVFADIVAVCDVTADGPISSSPFPFPSPGVATSPCRSASGSTNNAVIDANATSAVVHDDAVVVFVVGTATDDVIQEARRLTVGGVGGGENKLSAVERLPDSVVVDIETPATTTSNSSTDRR